MEKETTIIVKSDSGNIYMIDAENHHIGLSQQSGDEYFSKKINYLKEHGIGCPKSTEQLFLSGQDVKQQFINTLQIVFEVTDACNMNCRYCGYGDIYYDHDERCSSKMTMKQIESFFKYIKKLWHDNKGNSFNQPVYISFYGGEPLLNMQLIKSIVEYTETLISPFRNFRYSMTTNGILLPKHMDFLVNHKFNLLISLDGNSTNNSYRIDKQGKETFGQVTNNIDILREKHPLYFEKYVNFNSVLHNRNSVCEIYDFFSQVYAKNPSIGELNNMGIRGDRLAEFNQLYKNYSESLQDAKNPKEVEDGLFLNSNTYKDAGIFIHQYSGFVFKTYNDLLSHGQSKYFLSTGTCLPFSRKIFITVNGKILPCERIGHQFSLGQILDDKIEIDFDLIASKYNSWIRKIFNQCNQCYRIKACVQCIFNIEDIDSPCAACHGYMGRKKIARYFADNMTFLENHPKGYQKIMDEAIII
jgi:uncharacterized protein